VSHGTIKQARTNRPTASMNRHLLGSSASTGNSTDRSLASPLTTHSGKRRLGVVSGSFRTLAYAYRHIHQLRTQLLFESRQRTKQWKTQCQGASAECG
jgi:hypothetical protein